MAWLSGWNYRQKLTIDHTLIDADCTNFPVKVIVPSSNELFNKAKADGSDVRFTASDGATLLDFEQEIYAKSDSDNENMLLFDGLDDYITATIPEVNQNGLTFELRMKTDGKGTYAGVIGHGGRGAYNSWLFRESPEGNYHFFIDYNGTGGTVSIPSSLLNDGAWHWVAGTYDGSTAKLYVDGALKATNSFSATFSSTNLVIGRYEGATSDFYYFDGLISEVRIWNVARTQTEIQDNMNTTLSGTETGLVAYYKLDEGTGTTLTDYAGNNDGTIYGATWVTWVSSTAVYHVKIPLVSSTSDTDFYMYYGNPDATDASNPSAVWDNYYKLVMHMDSTLKDSTDNGNDGTNYGTVLGLDSTGHFRFFNGVDDFIDCGNDPSIAILGDLNIEIFFSTNYTSETRTYIAKRDASSNGWTVYTYSHSLTWWYKGALARNTSVSVRENGCYASLVFDSSEGEIRCYHDDSLSGIATLTATKDASPLSSDTASLYIGNSQYGPVNHYKGQYSEVRISSCVRSHAWMKATSYAFHDQLLTIGAQEVSPSQPTVVQYLMGVSGSLMKTESKESSISAYTSNPLEKYTSSSVVSVWKQIKETNALTELSRLLSLQGDVLSSLKASISNDISTVITNVVKILNNVSGTIENTAQEVIDILSNIENSQFISEDSSILIENTTLGEIRHYLSMLIEEKGIVGKEVSTLIKRSSELTKNIATIKEAVEKLSSELSSETLIAKLDSINVGVSNRLTQTIAENISTITENVEAITKEISTFIENIVFVEIRHYLSTLIEEKGITAKEMPTLAETKQKLTEQVSLLNDGALKLSRQLASIEEDVRKTQNRLNNLMELKAIYESEPNIAIKASETITQSISALLEISETVLSLYKTISEIANKFRTLSGFTDRE